MHEFACGLCEARFEDRDALIEHNVPAHGWSLEESREKVLAKYPA